MACGTGSVILVKYNDKGGGFRMELAKVLTNDGAQAVRLPNSCQLMDDEVVLNRIGNIASEIKSGIII